MEEALGAGEETAEAHDRLGVELVGPGLRAADLLGDLLQGHALVVVHLDDGLLRLGQPLHALMEDPPLLVDDRRRVRVRIRGADGLQDHERVQVLVLGIADDIFERHDLHDGGFEVEGVELIDVQLQVTGAVLVGDGAFALLRHQRLLGTGEHLLLRPDGAGDPVLLPEILEHGTPDHRDGVALELHPTGRLELVHGLDQGDQALLLQVLRRDLCRHGRNYPLPGLADQVPIVFNDEVAGGGRPVLLELDPASSEIVLYLGGCLSGTHAAPAPTWTRGI